MICKGKGVTTRTPLALYLQGVYNALHNLTLDDMRVVTRRFIDHVVCQLTV
jgi:hypothetical protein